MAEPLVRQLHMLRLIPQPPGSVDTRTLKQALEAQGWGIDLRTVQRDLNRLSGAFPITSDDGKPARWSWVGRALVDIPGMNPATALTFAMTERFLAAQLPRGMLEYLGPYFQLSKGVLCDLERPRLGAWVKKVSILPRGQKLLPPKVKPDVVSAVYEALLTDRCFAVRYRRRGESKTRHYEVNPLGLVFRDTVVYLVCTLFDYEDILHLLLHRMSRAELLEKKVRMPSDFSLDSYVASGAFSYPQEERAIKLVALLDAGVADHLHETALSGDQVLKDTKAGRVRLEATTVDSGELRWWLLGFGDGVEIVKPRRLKNEFSEIARNLVDLYGTGHSALRNHAVPATFAGGSPLLPGGRSTDRGARL